MNFSNEVRTTLTFSPILRTREQIQITAFFVILGRPPFTYYFPLVKEAPYLKQLTEELTQDAAATASAWTLGFDSAEDSLTKESFASLEREFREMHSPEFRVERVKVTSIIPLTPVKVKPAPKEDRAGQTINELMEDTMASIRVENFLQVIYEKYPEFKETPGGLRMKKMAERKAYDILLKRRDTSGPT